MKELFNAITNKDFVLLDSLLNKENINDLDSNGQNLLFYAVRDLNVEAVQFLLDRDIDTEVKTKYGDTILHVAGNICNEEIMSLLLEANPLLIDVRNDLGIAPIHNVCKRGSLECLLILLNAGANVNSVDENGESVLHYAVVSGKISIIDYILGFTDISINVIDERGKTPLHKACEKGLTAIIRYFVEMYANCDIADYLGNTPIHYAVINSSIQDVKFLLQNGSSVYTHNNKSESILDIVNNHFNFDMIDFLSTVVNDIQFFENKSNSKLQLAVKKNDLMLIKTLLDEKSKTNELDDFMKTALYYAICLNKLDVVRLLLENKANFSNSHVEIAKQIKSDNIVTLLK